MNESRRLQGVIVGTSQLENIELIVFKMKLLEKLLTSNHIDPSVSAVLVLGASAKKFC